VSLGMQSAFFTNFIIVSSCVSVVLLYSTTHMPYSITVLAKALIRWVFWEAVTLPLVLGFLFCLLGFNNPFIGPIHLVGHPLLGSWVKGKLPFIIYKLPHFIRLH